MIKIISTFFCSFLIKIIWGVLFSELLNLVFGVSHHYFETGRTNNLTNENFWMEGIIAPVFETLFYQLLPIWVIMNIWGKKVIAVLLSSVFFALIHGYTIFYVVAAFGSGVIYAAYFVYNVTVYRTYTKAYFLTALLHSGYNIIANFIP